MALKQSWKLAVIAASLGVAFAMPAAAQTSGTSKGSGASSSQSAKGDSASSGASGQSAGSGSSGQSAAGGQTSSLEQRNTRDSDESNWGWLGLLGLLGLGGLMRRREQHDVRYDNTRTVR